MIKTIALIARRSDLTQDAFKHHYESEHVRLAVPMLPALRKYVRNHRVDGDYGRGVCDGRKEGGRTSCECARERPQGGLQGTFSHSQSVSCVYPGRAWTLLWVLPSGTLHPPPQTRPARKEGLLVRARCGHVMSGAVTLTLTDEAPCLDTLSWLRL